MFGAWAAATAGKEEPNTAVLDVYWAAFRHLPIEDFEWAVDAHLHNTKQGMFVPRPAHLFAALEARSLQDGRPSADEAWGIALQASSEDATVVWTTEIRAAWAAAEPVAVAGRDKVGGRRAFIEAYERLVGMARDRGHPVQWEVSLGHDPYQRESAIEQAERLNRIGVTEARALIEMIRPLALPAPEEGGYAVPILQRLTELKQKLASDRAAREEKRVAELPKSVNVVALAEAAKWLPREEPTA